MISDKEENTAVLWSEIHRLRSEIAGPENYKTWKDAAIDNRVMLMSANERLLACAVIIGELSKSLPEGDPILAEIVRLGMGIDA